MAAASIGAKPGIIRQQGNKKQHPVSGRAAFLRPWLARMAPTLMVILLLPAFIGLGVWQLQRADYKRQLQHEYDARANEERIAISDRLREREVPILGNTRLVIHRRKNIGQLQILACLELPD